ncbi:MAG: mechanosensitive ion channel [Bacteroidetes bacterium]|nr:mechanosensitive ion channel [Bacteroidota bacterium]
MILQAQNSDSLLEKYVPLFQDMILEYGLKLIAAIAIIVIGFWISGRIGGMIAKTMRRREIDESLIGFTKGIIGAIIKIGAVLAAAQQFGIATTSFVAILGAAGLAIGMALSGTLQNFAGGFMILLLRPFKVGDFIETQGHMGTVKEIQIFHTVMLTGDNKRIIIPNAPIANGSLINYSAEDLRRVDLVFGISYTDNIDKARDLINGVISADERILKDPAPFVAVKELADSSVNFVVRVWANKADYWGIYFAMQENVKKSFDDNNVSIPFPQMDVHVNQN